MIQKRIRVGTLMLLVIIIGLGLALIVRERRAVRREAEFAAQIARIYSTHDREMTLIRLNNAQAERRQKLLKSAVDSNRQSDSR